MPLKRTPTTEEIRRREGIDSFVRSLGTGVKELGNVWKERFLSPVKAASRVGGALLGKDTGATNEDIIEAVLGGVTLGTPGGLPKGAIGVGQTRNEALKTLGQSAAKIRNVPKLYIPEEGLTRSAKRLFKDIRLDKQAVRDMADTIRKSPKEILDPLSSVGYKKFKNRRYLGLTTAKSGSRTSKVELAARAGPNTFFHEAGGHVFSNAARRERNLSGYFADALETASEIGNLRALKLNKLSGKTKSFYKNDPPEEHARRVAKGLTDLSKSGPISGAEHSKIFNQTAKTVLKGLKKKAPTIHRKALRKVAHNYRKEAAFKRYVEEGIQKGRAPGTFNEWYYGLTVKSPQSRASKATKPGLPTLLHSPSIKKSFNDQLTFTERLGERSNFTRGRKDLERVVLPKNYKEVSLFDLRKKAGIANNDMKGLSRIAEKALKEGADVVEGGMWGTAVNPKLKRVPFSEGKSGLPMKTEDIVKLIKKLPKSEVKKIKIKRKAD